MNDRCLMLTTRAFDGDCTYLQGILDDRKADEARLLAARGEVINGIQYCICGNKLPKDVGKHLQTQLHERGCRKKGIWQVVQELPESDAVDVLVDVLDAAAFVTPPPQLLPAASPELSESTRFQSRKRMARANFVWEFENAQVGQSSASLQLSLSL